ncbi:MAG: ribose 1,5-bisphosphate isomerase [Candidatus Thermoplasmatota archaeon]|nr:ribose 1,5-bisphosphate isomerase [Candidatus Thermoplasmatota archaeon]MBU4070838.1 ribose 1,5-bisphosphate isomerase [Candidatus Thermoplasmatota archaeon]MBU4143521.1 ribose 1,5-bisphosphate isomerase [Candidatus Thermoplasmatota archaeon]MBU4591967.1 ribose 1,5-bisphosphate isomerase [Candidatus Thermoplasmatota archaeon]
MDIEETASKIEDMTIRGAGRIARAAAAALGEYAESTSDMKLKEFLESISNAAQRLVSTRPTAISLHNGVRITLRGVDSRKDFKSARALVISNAAAFVEHSNSAVEKVGQLAPALMKKPGKVITICNSSAAVSAMVACHKAGKVTGVYACETRPRRQGLITARELSEAGVPVTLIVDSAMRYVMPEVSIAFVGTDTLESDGSVINKIGTHLLAATARDFKVPFYACAETYKFLPSSKIGRRVEIEKRSSREIVSNAEIPGSVEIFNPVFDRVPPELVTGIITEVGVIKPADAIKIIKKYLGGI